MWGKGCCVFDDKVNEFLAAAGDYDGFIFASLVHYAGATGALTSFMGRAFFADLHSGKKRFYLKPADAGKKYGMVPEMQGGRGKDGETVRKLRKSNLTN